MNISMSRKNKNNSNDFLKNMELFQKTLFIIMILILISSWTFLIYDIKNDNKKYNELLHDANNMLEKKIYVDASEHLKEAINIYPNKMEAKYLLAKAYRDGNMIYKLEEYCNRMCKKYSSDEKFVIILGDYYKKIDRYDKAIRWYKSNADRFDEKSLIFKELSQLKSKFEIKYQTYDNISDFDNGYAIFEKNEKFGIINDLGNIIINPEYDYLKCFGDYKRKKLAPAKKNGETIYIDENNNRRLVADYNYEYLGNFSKNGYAVFKKRENYGYIDTDFNEYLSNCEYASSFGNYDKAIIKQDGKWYLISKELKILNEIACDDVKINEHNSAINCDILIIKKDNKEFLMDLKGNLINKVGFDEIEFFEENGAATAFRIDDKWGFIDSAGNIVIDAKYKCAKAFSCEFAPVLLDNLWGYIDINENLIIKPQFSYARCFNKKGVAPIMKNDKWQLIELEYYKEGI